MIGSKKITCVIPARLASSRFPRKMLHLLKGKPLIEWVYRSAQRISFFDELAVATDSQEIYDVIAKAGGQVFLTSPKCASGTDRLIELLTKGVLSGDIWINWQGDEPFIEESILKTLLHTVESSTADLWTLKKKITNLSEITSPHTPKVVCNAQGCALYFSRSTIPYHRDQDERHCPTYFKHIGMYAFKRETLKHISSLKPCATELSENLEQLRFLDAGLQIEVHETHSSVLGIDLPEHMVLAEQMATPALYKKLFETS